MEIETRKFGKIEISEKKIITMPIGLPGFPGKNRYILLEREETRPLCWFQSVDDPKLTLALINPYVIKPDYQINKQCILDQLSWGDEEENKENILLFVVVTVQQVDPLKMTANLIGPIFVNSKKLEAVQAVIYDTPYSHQHPII